MREFFEMECTVCRHRNYASLKNKKTAQGRLERSKYCRFCRKHTAHKELK